MDGWSSQTTRQTDGWMGELNERPENNSPNEWTDGE